MTTPAINWTRDGTSTPSKYRFVLSFVLHSEIGNLELKHAPLEWKEIELLLKRDTETHGVYITAVVNSLTFIKEGKNLLQELYASKGVFSICDLFIYYLDHATRTYVSMPTSYKLDFNSYKLVNLTKSTNGIQISALPTDTISKFQQRKATPVNLNKLTSIGGLTIDPGTPLKTLAIPAIKAFKTANFSNTETNLFNETDSAIPIFIYPPQTSIFSDFTEVVHVPYNETTSQNHLQSMMANMVAETIFNVKGVIDIDITTITGTDSNIAFWLRVYDIDDNVLSEAYMFEYGPSDSGVQSVTFDKNITAPIGSYVAVVAVATFDASPSTITVNFIGTQTIFTQTIATSPATVVDTFPVYDALERNLQLILDQQFPFYSEFFGPNDKAFDLIGTLYTAESQLRFANLVSGLGIRGVTHSMPEVNTSTNFTALFKAIKAIWNVGGGFETLPDDSFRFRIEALSHFYQEVELLDFTARVNEIEIEREQNSEAMFAKIQTGYGKFEYDQVMGRGEYNTSANRTTVVPNDNQFDNVSAIRADTMGILKSLLKNIESAGSEDLDADSDLFIIKSQRGTVTDWKAETNENVTIEGNTSYFQEGSLNLYFTPTRNLIRNGQIVNAGLALMPGTKLAYQTSDKNNQLRTTGEGYTISENEDITASDLADPLWYPELLTVTLPFYEADYVTLSANPLGYIRLSDNLTGWVMDIKWKFSQNEATLVLIRRITPPLS